MCPVTVMPDPPASARRAPELAAASQVHDLGLIGAKLLVPRVPTGSVHRTELLRRLRASRDHRIVSVLAPAGYGKTTSLAQWAATDRRPVAWLTADNGDNDPEVFLSYLGAALSRIVPLDPDIFAAIRRRSVSDRAVVGRLLTAVQDYAAPVLIVLDDAHRITDQACLDALAEFITYLPAPSQVAIGSREPVGLPFSRWRADGSLLEIGPADLAMNDREAAGLARLPGLEVPPDVLARLARRTEGWPALLALAARAAHRAPDQDRSGAEHDLRIADYLRSEVLEGRPDAEVAFLTRTSILERLAGPICDVVADATDSTELLARLARSTLLVDDYAGSYRYHSLLGDFLRAELNAREPERIPELHRRAAIWYDANGSTDLAVDHALAAADVDLAAVMVGRAMTRYHWSGRRATNRAWFRRFSAPSLAAHPWLAVLAAWEELGAGDVTTTRYLADVAEASSFEGRPPDGTASFESGRAMLRAAMVRQGSNIALANATLAVELEVPGNPWRDFALWQVAIVRRMTGDATGADATVAEAIDAARWSGHDSLGYCLLGYRALLATEAGDWAAAIALTGDGDDLRVATAVEGYLSSIPARAARIRVAIHRGDIASARRELARATTLRPLLSSACPAFAVECLLALARAHLALADSAGTRTLLTQAVQIIRDQPDLGVLTDEVSALRATVATAPLGVAGISSLTAAELRVLALLPYYLSFKEIGQRLGVKATTIKTHALAIYGKLGASTRSEAVEIAVEAGLLDQFLT